MQSVGMTLEDIFLRLTTDRGELRMRTVHAVAWKEVQIYFSSPTAYIVGMIIPGPDGSVLRQGLGAIPQQPPSPKRPWSGFFQGAAIILILMAPTLTMRPAGRGTEAGHHRNSC